MSRRLGVLTLVLPLLTAWAWSGSTLVTQTATGAGKLEIAPRELVFDRADDRPSKPARLTLRNVGDRPVRILDATSTCGCTVPDLPKTVSIEPGGSFMLAVTGSPPGIGEKQATLKIRTDSPSQELIRVPVVLKGKPLEVPFVTTMSERFDLRTTRSEPIRHEFSVHTREAAGLEPWLGEATADSPGCKVTLIDITEEPAPANSVRRHYRFRFTTPQPPRDGTPQTVHLQFTTTRPAQKAPSPVRVVYRFVPPVRAVPGELFFRLGDSETRPVERTIIFQTEGATNVEIKPEPMDDAWLAVSEIEPQPAGSTLAGRATVRLLPDHLPDSAAETTLRFRTDHPDCPTIAVRVHVVGDRSP